MNFEQILSKCGDWNRYQYLLLALFGFINIVTGFHYFSQTVIGFVPQHWCYHEKLANASFEEIAAIYANVSNPSCTRLVDFSADNVTISAEKCDRWIYKYDYGFRSMNVEFDWVCDRAYKARVGQSFFFVGTVIGTLVFGLLTDVIGRLPALILANLCGFIGDFSTIFAANVPTFSLCRFVSGLAVDTNFNGMFILVLEYLSASKRSIGINLTVGLFFNLALFCMPWLAAYVGNWRNFLICTSLPLLLVPFFYFIVQDSADWLVTKNDIDGAIKRLQRIAKFNRRQVPECDFNDFRQHCEQKRKIRQSSKQANFFDMFKTPRMRRMTIIMFFQSMIPILCFDVVIRNVDDMGISPFIMFSLGATTGVPARLIISLLQDRIGRKATAASSLFYSGCISAVTAVVHFLPQFKENALLIFWLSMGARLGVSISRASSTQHAIELIPTTVRGQGSAAVRVTGYAAAFLSPYLLLLGSHSKAAISLVLALLFFIGCFVCLLLPDTLNRPLPQTLEEGEVFGIGEGIFDFPCCKRRNSQANNDAELEPMKQSNASDAAKLD